MHRGLFGGIWVIAQGGKKEVGFDFWNAANGSERGYGQDARATGGGFFLGGGFIRKCLSGGLLR